MDHVVYVLGLLLGVGGGHSALVDMTLQRAYRELPGLDCLKQITEELTPHRFKNKGLLITPRES